MPEPEETEESITMMTNESQQAGTAANGGEVEGFINKVETARRLNCALRTLDTWMKRGLIPYYKISKKVGFKWSEVEVALRENSRVNRGGFKI